MSFVSSTRAFLASARGAADCSDPASAVCDCALTSQGRPFCAVWGLPPQERGSTHLIARRSALDIAAGETPLPTFTALPSAQAAKLQASTPLEPYATRRCASADIRAQRLLKPRHDCDCIPAPWTIHTGPYIAHYIASTLPGSHASSYVLSLSRLQLPHSFQVIVSSMGAGLHENT